MSTHDAFDFGVAVSVAGSLASVTLIAVGALVPVPLPVSLGIVWGVVLTLTVAHVAINRKWQVVAGVVLWMVSLVLLVLAVGGILVAMALSVIWMMR